MKFLPKTVDKDNVMLCNIIYNRANGDNPDTLDVVYKELHTGLKYVESIEKPKINIYFAKEEYRNYNYNKAYMPLNECDVHEVQYSAIPWYIAKNSGDSTYADMLKMALETKQFRYIGKMHQYPYVFGSDIPIETFYRTQWLLNYDNSNEKRLTKGFLDIEVDTIDTVGFPKDGTCPINAISIVDGAGYKVFTFLLNNPDNPQIKEFVDDIESFNDQLHAEFDEYYGHFDYEIFMYDDEWELLKDTFKLIHTLKLDFMLIWNGFGFDIPYIIERIKNLGHEPEDIMCHPDFSGRQCYFKKDQINFKVANKSDCLKLTSYTKYIDQMILYAATRKAQSELRSFNLNYIAKKELGDEKLDYSDEANIKTLPYVNYRKFVLYNIKDTLLQYGIEKRTNDVDGLYNNTYMNCTDYDNAFKQTVMLKGRFYYEYFLNGVILGNNVNVFNPISKGSFTGALVGDPLLNSNTGIDIFGKTSKYVYNFVIDMDYSSLYPNIITAFNIERNTMIGKLVIPGITQDTYDHVFVNTEVLSGEDDMEDYEDTKYDSGQDFVDNYLTGDILSIATKWFNLPSFDQLNEKFKKKFQK